MDVNTKFKVNQIVKVANRRSPYFHMAGRVTKVDKSESKTTYWLMFSYPPLGLPYLNHFDERQLVLAKDFYLKRDVEQRVSK